MSSLPTAWSAVRHFVLVVLRQIAGDRTTLFFLVVLGATAAQMGGAPRVRGAVRVAFWGAVAMGATALVGKLFGTVV